MRLGYPAFRASARSYAAARFALQDAGLPVGGVLPGGEFSVGLGLVAGFDALAVGDPFGVGSLSRPGSEIGE